MKRILKDNNDKSFECSGLLFLFFIQIVIFFFLLISNSFFAISFLIIIFCIQTTIIIITIKFFFAKEECFCENGKFYYIKTLFHKWQIKTISLPILDIKSIYDAGRIKLKKFDKIKTGTFYYYYFLNYKERICIETISGEKYYFWNYVKVPNSFDTCDNSEDNLFFKELDEIQKMIKLEQFEIEFKEKIKTLIEIYNFDLNQRYQEILKKIIEEEKFYISQMGERTLINGGETAIENLEIFKNMEWEEVNFYTFYVNFLSKKENADKVVEVAYNGEDSKRVKVSELREDINRIRYPQDYVN